MATSRLGMGGAPAIIHAYSAPRLIKDVEHAVGYRREDVGVIYYYNSRHDPVQVTGGKRHIARSIFKV